MVCAFPAPVILKRGGRPASPSKRYWGRLRVIYTSRPTRSTYPGEQACLQAHTHFISGSFTVVTDLDQQSLLAGARYQTEATFSCLADGMWMRVTSFIALLWLVSVLFTARRYAITQPTAAQSMHQKSIETASLSQWLNVNLSSCCVVFVCDTRRAQQTAGDTNVP